MRGGAEFGGSQTFDGTPVFLANPETGETYTLDQANLWKNYAVAAGAGSGAEVISAVPGRVVSILVTTLGTAALTLYDNDKPAASGTIVGYVPASTAAGTSIPVNSGAVYGITAGRALNTPAVTVTYTVN